MALGYDNSYVIPLGSGWDLGGMRYKFNLNGHYKDLDKFDKDNKSMQIVDPLDLRGQKGLKLIV
ncbi:hypothetical protein N7467_002213 [Penicillium canescens]|nr:hypothetical protein N7467_002213 [Penicillium canescens]